MAQSDEALDKLNALIERMTQTTRELTEAHLASLSLDGEEGRIKRKEIVNGLDELERVVRTEMAEPILRKAFFKRVDQVRDQITHHENEIRRLNLVLSGLRLVCPHVRDQGCDCDYCGQPAGIDD